MKRAISWFLVSELLCGHLSIAQAAQAERYEVILNEEDGYYIVINPNGGPTLSYGADNGVNLIEVEEDGYVYAFKDMSKDGELDPYEDWRLDADERAWDLANKLSIEQISALKLNAFHMTAGYNADGSLSDYHRIGIQDTFIRYILYVGRGQSFRAAVKFNNSAQRLSEAAEWGIPVMFCSDPRNSARSPQDALANESSGSGWPSNLAMGATFDPTWALLLGQAASDEYRAIGVSLALSPQIDLATEPRWSRVSGTWGESSQLTSEFAANYVSGFQSTWDGYGTGAADLGWGEDSVGTMAKHYPGDGPGEAGREAHNNYGKYAVYPGNNMAEHLVPFDAIMNLPTLTEQTAAVMPSYSIAYNSFGPIGEPKASGFSAYKLQTLLRDQLGFKGMVTSDWGIRSAKAWGVENESMVTRYYTAYMKGMDQLGLPSDPRYPYLAYEMGVYANTTIDEYNDPEAATHEDVDGAVIMDENYRTSAQRILRTAIKTGIYENPYVSTANAEAVFSNEEYAYTGYEAQLASVVLMKNKGQVISETSGEKKTVYIPMIFTSNNPESTTSAGEANYTGDWSRVGFEDFSLSGYAADIDTASRYFNVVTDTIREGADNAKLTPDDVVRVTDFTDIDFALVAISNPSGNRGYDAKRVNLDPANGPIDNGYIPISLMYGEYYADPEVVREYPIAVDPDEELAWIAAGGEAGRSRYYGGKTVKVSNSSSLDLVLETAERTGDLPVVVYVSISNPMCFFEFEPEVEGIVAGFGVCMDAVMEVLSGQYEPNGLLPLQMPAGMTTVEQQYEDVPRDMECHVDTEGNTYDFAFGLNWDGVINDERVAKYY